MGWILILGQHDWPRYAANIDFAVNSIGKECRQSGFSHPNLLNYIAEPSVLEELAWLSNSVVRKTQINKQTKQYKLLLITF